MLGEGWPLVNPPNDDILGGVMTNRMRCFSGCLAVLFLVAGCAAQVPRYVISPAKGQTSQQLDNDKFDCNLQAQTQTDYNPDKALTEGALVGLLVGGAAGAGLGAAAGAAGGIVGTGASVGAIAGGGIGATLGGSYLYDKDLNKTQRAYYACLETRGYTLTK
jgi:phage tail tape-measure protein